MKSAREQREELLAHTEAKRERAAARIAQLETGRGMLLIGQPGGPAKDITRDAIERDRALLATLDDGIARLKAELAPDAP